MHLTSLGKPVLTVKSAKLDSLSVRKSMTSFFKPNARIYMHTAASFSPLSSARDGACAQGRGLGPHPRTGKQQRPLPFAALGAPSGLESLTSFRGGSNQAA